MLPIIAALLPVINKFIPDRDKQAEVLLEMEKIALEQSKLQANIINKEQDSEILLIRLWRPILMYLCMAMILTHFILFIIVPYFIVLFNLPYYTMVDPGFSEGLWNFLYIGVGGYIGARTYEKIKTKR